MKKSMKLMFVFAALFLFANLSQAQSVWEQWPEAKTFHEVMSKTFHPSEEGNLEPIKTRIGEMVKKADAWMNSKAPEAYNKQNIKDGLAKLSKETKELEKEINSKESDEKIKTELAKLHDVFHDVVGACNNKEEKHGNHDGHGH
ncbi:MAG: hypothetical protein ACOYNH_06950 [Bacteroidia bacterium]|jgi:flagellar motor protein MotB